MSFPVTELRWPKHLLPLKEVDNLLRCGICFDYFNTAMIIPQCSHNYCSLCIRKSLSYKPQCPICCMVATGPDLKNNRILDELVHNFVSARQRLFQAVLDSPSISSPTLLPKKAPPQDHILNSPDGFFLNQKKHCADTFQVNEKRHLISADKDKNIKIKQEENPCSSELCSEAGGKVANTAPTGGIKNSEMPSTSATKFVTKVECPVCGVPVQELHINNHLDSCLTRDEKKDSLRSSGQKRKLLPKLVYSLLSDRDLRKRLKEHGLSTHGTKQQLIKRHQEFVHMYNSECDSLNPKSVAEIVKELENIEKTQAQLDASKPKEDNMVFTKHQTENEIDEIHRDYRKKHKAEYQLLIDQMKKRKKNTSKEQMKEERPEQKEERPEQKEAITESGEKLRVQEQSDQASVSNHSPETEAAAWEENLSLFAACQSSASSNSSSSDIIRDLEIDGMCSNSSDKEYP
ncbi:E3 ubiquitin-protein ligase RAD18 isoform X2 [Pseudonaja textilis]|uniref:E3 ubiquitin-protein ligase RAD18 isoform X2 n=1 Tax=Pseudonaja textilis TaxID=8673 RepID=UPI000EA86F50|nr:E3 ubiquitin-protein ligase RAD18 isoform X2 [Pseudonaja textilis]